MGCNDSKLYVRELCRWSLEASLLMVGRNQNHLTAWNLYLSLQSLLQVVSLQDSAVHLLVGLLVNPRVDLGAHLITVREPATTITCHREWRPAYHGNKPLMTLASPPICVVGEGSNIVLLATFYHRTLRRSISNVSFV